LGWIPGFIIFLDQFELARHVAPRHRRGSGDTLLN
jgi:hypothetical protein